MDNFEVGHEMASVNDLDAGQTKEDLEKDLGIVFQVEPNIASEVVSKEKISDEDLMKGSENETDVSEGILDANSGGEKPTENLNFEHKYSKEDSDVHDAAVDRVISYNKHIRSELHFFSKLFLASVPRRFCTTGNCDTKHYICWFCEDVYCTYADYQQHIRRYELIVHLECPVCQTTKKFTNMCNMMRHLTLHPEAKYNIDYYYVDFRPESTNYRSMMNNAPRTTNENIGSVLENNEVIPRANDNDSHSFQSNLDYFWEYIFGKI